AAMILKVAKLGDMPARILAGEDSYEMGTGADACRSASAARWEKLGPSATVAEPPTARRCHACSRIPSRPALSAGLSRYWLRRGSYYHCNQLAPTRPIL